MENDTYTQNGPLVLDDVQIEAVSGAAAVWDAMGNYCGDDGKPEAPPRPPKPPKPPGDEYRLNTPLAALGIRG